MDDLIISLASRGDGQSASGTFYAGTAPGDHVSPDGQIVRGPHYQAPACRHYGQCGGCQLQHVDEASYARFVTDRIVDALKAQGLVCPDIRPPHLSPPQTRRRIALRALKMGRRIVLGYAESKTHKLVDIHECPVMHPALMALIAPLRLFLQTAMRDRKPADIRMTLVDQGVDLTIAGIEIDGLAATEALTAFAEKHVLARLSIDEGYGPSPRWEPRKVTVTFSGVSVDFPEGAFLQATLDGEGALLACAKEVVGDVQSIVDLFAGLGTFSFAQSGEVYAVEGARDAILSLQSAANRTVRPVTAEHRDLFRRPLTAKELARFDAIIIDPPRTGAKDQVAEIAASSVPKIASISCNPSTFARDARMLVDGGYTLKWIQPVGQFRWSTHVELAACFTRQS
jgi:23S rRNA (uracil1939-C5)-methyltransferase